MWWPGTKAVGKYTFSIISRNGSCSSLGTLKPAQKSILPRSVVTKFHHYPVQSTGGKVFCMISSNGSYDPCGTLDLKFRNTRRYSYTKTIVTVFDIVEVNYRRRCILSICPPHPSKINGYGTLIMGLCDSILFPSPFAWPIFYMFTSQLLVPIAFRCC